MIIPDTGLPHRIGPHGIDLDKPRGVTRNRIEGVSAQIAAKLRAEVERKAEADRIESRKRTVNSGRASGRGKAAI